MKTRRDFLTCCSLLAVGAALEPVEALSAPLLRRVPSFDQFGLSTFAKCVHTPFRVIQNGRLMVRLELIEARSTSDARLSRAVEGDSAGHEFSLLFRGPHDVALTQDTYSFEHAALGRFSMFIVPVCPPDNGTCYYEAIFNRLPGPVV